MPSSLVTSERVPCIDGLEIVTVTPGRIAPDESVTLPLMAPVVALTVWPIAAAAGMTVNARTKRGIGTCSRLMSLLRVSERMRD